MKVANENQFSLTVKIGQAVPNERNPVSYMLWFKSFIENISETQSLDQKPNVISVIWLFIMVLTNGLKYSAS
jgi:hypothetical protein